LSVSSAVRVRVIPEKQTAILNYYYYSIH
jgi:hypothetical protein